MNVQNELLQRHHEAGASVLDSADFDAGILEEPAQLLLRALHVIDPIDERTGALIRAFAGVERIGKLHVPANAPVVHKQYPSPPSSIPCKARSLSSVSWQGLWLVNPRRPE